MAVDYSDEYTNDELIKLEKRLAKEYKQASKEIQKKYDDFINGYDEEVNGKKVHHKSLKEKCDDMKKKVKNGEMTQNEYDKWYIGQIITSERWLALRDDMASRVTASKKRAEELINGTTPSIYAENYNHEAYKIEKYASKKYKNMDISFDLVDEHTIRRVAGGKTSLLPKSRVNVSKEQRWNQKKMQNALLQGLLQGESIDKIALRFQAVASMSMRSAICNARTAVTGAQNGGRIASYKDAEKMGIEIVKEWISTADGRTRISHVMLDGVRVPQGKFFPNGLEYPGDMRGSPAELYNCRCTIRAILPGINDEPRTENNVDSYNEWKNEKKSSGQVQKP